MALDLIEFAMQTVAFLLTVVAAYFAYLIYKANKLSRGWLVIAATVVIVGLGRILDFFLLAGGNQSHPTIEFLDRPLIPLVVSVMMIAGFWYIKQDLDSSDTLMKMARERIKRFASYQNKVLKKKPR